MAFKLKAPYQTNITPVYHVDEEDGVLGRANNNGTIVINNKIKDRKKYPRKNGKIKYNGKFIPEGSKIFPWEKEAYLKEKK